MSSQDEQATQGPIMEASANPPEIINVTAPPLLCIDVDVCPACKQRHVGVQARRYQAENPYTHWFLCPTTGDPVSLVLELGDEVADVRPEIIAALVDARKSGKYCVAVFTPLVDQPTGVLLRRFTQGFPTACFASCVQALQENLDKEAGPPPRQPLRQVDRIPPMVNLFGRPGE